MVNIKVFISNLFSLEAVKYTIIDCFSKQIGINCGNTKKGIFARVIKMEQN